MTTPELQVNGMLIIFFGLLAIAALVFWMWRLRKKYPKMPMGEILSMVFVKDSETIFIFSCILINFSEAVMAASIHPAGETPPNPLARILSHGLISFVAISAGVTLIRDMAKIFVKKIGTSQVVARLFKVILVTTAAIGLPIVNMYLIANGLNESIALSLFMASWNPFVSDAQLAQVLTFYNLPPNYSYWDGLSYVMSTTVALTGAHMLLVGIEGFNNMDSTNKVRFNKMFEGLEDDNEKGEKDDKGKDKGDKGKDDKEKDIMEAEKRLLEKVKDNLSYLLRRVGYSGEGLTQNRDTAAGKLDKMVLQEQAKMAERIAQLVNASKTLDSQTDLKDEEKKKKKKEIEDKIRSLFGNSPKEADLEKRGFGITLKK
jgi:hypothetical protein